MCDRLSSKKITKARKFETRIGLFHYEKIALSLDDLSACDGLECKYEIHA